MTTIDVGSVEKKKAKVFRDPDYMTFEEKWEKTLKNPKTPSREVERVAERADLVKLRDEALAVYESLSMELDLETEPKYNAPLTWSFYSAKELQRGDALIIDGAIYLYLDKLAWWRNKTANILVAHHDNPDNQKRIGEVDFVYAYKGYVLAKQMAKVGVVF